MMTRDESRREFNGELLEGLERAEALLGSDPLDTARLGVLFESLQQSALWRGYDEEQHLLERLRAVVSRVDPGSADLKDALGEALASWRKTLKSRGKKAAAALEDALGRLEELPDSEAPGLVELLELGAGLAAGLSGSDPADHQSVIELIELLRRLRSHHGTEPAATLLIEEVYEELENARRSGAPLGEETALLVAAAFARALGLEEEAPQQETPIPDAEVADTGETTGGSLAERLFSSFKPRGAGTPPSAQPRREALPAPEPTPEPPAVEELAEPAASPTGGGLRSEMLDIFTGEAEELVDQLNRNLLLLEGEPDNPELVRELMRLAHTLKGAAAMLGFALMSRVARAMEDLLNIADEKGVAVGERGVDLLFTLTDQAAMLLEDLGEAGGDVELDDERQRELEGLLREIDEVSRELETSGAEAQSLREAGSVVAATTGRGFRVDPLRLDHLLNLAGELVIARTRINDILARLTGLYDVYAKRLAGMRHLADRLEAYGAAGVAVGEAARGAGRVDAHRTISDFSAHEFDRFSELDTLTRDVRGLTSAFDELSEDYNEATVLLSERLNELSLIAGNIQDEVTMVRMVPFGTVATRFRRAARDIARYYGKEIDFQTVGDETEIDKKLLDELLTPITHLLRNAVAHGVETQDDRLAAGKPSAGTVRLEVFHLGNSVVIEVFDDGAGILPEVIGARAVEMGLLTREQLRQLDDEHLRRLIFQPGFTTAEEVTETAGRGYGLDIVEKRLKEMRGTVEIESQPSSHTRFILTLPLTLGISEGLFIGVAGQTYALPLVEVEETLSFDPELVTTLSGREVYRHRTLLLPILRLNRLFGGDEEGRDGYVVIVRSGEGQLALIIETLLGKEEMVIKPTGGLLKSLPLFAGATTLGDGTVALIINPDELSSTVETAAPVRTARRRAEVVEPLAEAPPVAPVPHEVKPREKVREEKLELVPDAAGEGFGISVLLVDDSVSIRNFVGRMLSRRGFEVRTAADGLEALALLQERDFDCVLTDLEMPRMHGYELISEIKSSARTRHLPVMILTARTGEKHRQRARELGVEVFLTKPFNERSLVDQLIRLSRG